MTNRAAATGDYMAPLAGRSNPLPLGMILWRLATALAVGLAGSLVLMLVVLGPRKDLAAALATTPFWLKIGYALVLAACGFVAVTRLARPAGDALVPALAALVLVALFAGVAASEIAGESASHRADLILGSSALACPWLIAFLALPLMAGLLWAMRGFAPADLRATGLAAGLLAGAAAALVYGFHCSEIGVAFIVVWYAAGIAIAGAIGWLVGPPLLRG
jgi:hypothetical protein